MSYSDAATPYLASAGGVYRPRSSAYAADDSDSNLFLKSVLEPWLGAITPVPDDNLRGTILKTTHINTTLTSANTNQYLFVIPFGSPRRCIRVYAWDAVTSKYYFLQTFEQDEDLSAFFKLMRLVSGGMRIKSSTLSGTNFTVSGNFNAIVYYDLPDLGLISHENLVSFKRNNAGAVGGVPASDGVTTLAIPDSDHLFDVARVINATYNAKQVARLQAAIGASGPYADVAEHNLFTDLRLSAGGAGLVVPPNAWGAMRLRATLQFICSVAPASPSSVYVRLTATYASSNPANYQLQSTALTTTSVIQISATGQFTVPLENFFDRDDELLSVVLTIQATVAMTYNVIGDWVGVEYYDIERDNIQGPGSMISVKSLNAGQQISLDSVFNYEVVPDATLSRNVASGFPAAKEYTDLEVAHTILAHAAEMGIRFIMPSPDYDNANLNRSLPQYSNKDASVARAASLGSVAAKLWQILKPSIRTAGTAGIGALGGALTPYLGPAAPILSRYGAGLFNQALAADSQNSGYADGPKIAYAASETGAPTQAPPLPGTLPVTSTAEGLEVGEVLAYESVSEDEDDLPDPHLPFSGYNNLTPEIAALLHAGPTPPTAYASSAAFLPTLEEILEARRAPAPAAPAPAAVLSLDSHADPSRFQFDRESSPLNPIIEAYARTGDLAPVKAHFEKLGVIGHRARAVFTVPGPGGAPRALPSVDIYLTDRPVKRLKERDSLPQYRQVSLPGSTATILVDTVLVDAPKDWSWMTGSVPLLMSFLDMTRRQLHVTVSHRGSLDSVLGTSWHMAFYAGLSLCPYGAIFSGSLEAYATDISAKGAAGIATVGKPNPVVILRPEVESLKAASSLFESNGMRVRAENPLGGGPGIPALYVSESLGACLNYSFIAVSSITSPVAEAKKQANVQQHKAVLLAHHPQAFNSKHTVQIGAKRREVDFADFSVDEYVKLPGAMEALERASQGKGAVHLINKWKQIMSARPVNYAAMAGRYANVESLRESRLASTTPQTPAAPGMGNPKNKAKREKEKAKRKANLLAVAVPAAPAAKQPPPRVESDVEMSPAPAAGKRKAQPSESFLGLD